MAELGNPQNTIEVLQKYRFNFQKKFGQNFLIDTHVLDKIIDASGVTEDDFVLEIGPGIGTMTQYLCERAREVVAVEIDKNLIPILSDTLKNYSNVTVINEDILKLDICKLAEEKNQGKPIKVVANLPYYITTPIIMGLFESHVPIDSITIMVQKEVAERMQEGPGSKEYGALSLAVQYYAKPEIVANVPPNCFMPRPNVGSAVIRLTRHEKPPVEVEDEKLMFRIIRASFNQRRKTLANGLNNSPEIHLPKEVIQESIVSLGVPENIRGEALSLEQFAELSKGNIQNCNAAGTVTGSHPTIAPGGFIGYDNNGTTAGCAFDKKKNPSLNAVGADSGTPGSNQIKAADTTSLLSNICGSYLGGHTLSKVDRKEATHLTEGNIQYWVCANCGGYFSDASGANMITSLDVVIAKTAEHTADRTGWYSDADNHWNTCECGEKINQSGHSFTWVIDKEATSTEKGSKHEQCTVCNYAKTAVEIPPVKTGTEETKTSYKIIEGSESSYVLQSGNSLTIRVDAEFSKFAGIKVDGVQIGKDNYDVKSGSTIVTLKSSYLNTLTAGTHNLEMLWTDGSASTTFTIQASVNQNPDNKNQETATASNTQPATQTNTKQTTDKSPKTGDYNNPLVWAAWLIVSEIIIAGTVYYRKKKHL